MDSGFARYARAPEWRLVGRRAPDAAQRVSGALL